MKNRYKNTLFYCITYKTLFDSKPLHVKFDEVDGFIRVCNGIRYLVLLVSEKYDSIYNRIRCPKSQKNGI